MKNHFLTTIKHFCFSQIILDVRVQYFFFYFKTLFYPIVYSDDIYELKKCFLKCLLINIMMLIRSQIKFTFFISSSVM